MLYKGLKLGFFMLLIVFYILYSNALNNTPQPVMNINNAFIPLQALTKSVGIINSIEYKQIIYIKKALELKPMAEMHYYFKKPNNLRIETKIQDSINIDIYTPEGFYEYIPSSNIVYFREKWKDNKPISYQLEDKLNDIMLKNKYEIYKYEKIDGIQCELLRCVDEFNEEIYEHRVWLGNLDGYKLPLKEEFLIDGETTSIHKYEYISINKDIDESFFNVKNNKNIKIYKIEGIPKLVKDEKEAEKYVGFSVIIPDYKPKGFIINEIFIIPPTNNPTVLISYLSDTDVIYFNQKNIKKNELIIKNNEKVINIKDKKFVYSKLPEKNISVRWVKNGIEYDISGPEKYKDEIIKLVHSISGYWIGID